VIHITPHKRAWVTVQPMDFRAGINGLAAACGKRVAADPLSGALFAFGNGARIAINVLVYEGRGFWSATWARPVVGGPGEPTSSRRAGRPTSSLSTREPAAREQRRTSGSVQFFFARVAIGRTKASGLPLKPTKP